MVLPRTRIISCREFTLQNDFMLVSTATAHIVMTELLDLRDLFVAWDAVNPDIPAVISKVYVGEVGLLSPGHY